MLPRAGWTLLGALALVALAVAVGMLTVFAPAQQVGGTVTGPGPIVTGAGVARLTGHDLTVTAAGASVFVGVARHDDVQAWLGEAAVIEVAGLIDENGLRVRPPAAMTSDAVTSDAVTSAAMTSDAAAPGGSPPADPALSDIWLDSVAAAGTAELTVARPPADWAILVLGADEAGLTWQRPARHPGGWPLLAGAALLLGVAAHGLARRNAALRARRRHRPRLAHSAGLRQA